MEQAVERLLAAMDAIDEPSMNCEDRADAEPSLSFPEHAGRGYEHHHFGDDLDREFEGNGCAECDLEEQHDREYDEAELSGIGDYDGYIEQLVGEPSLGATLDFDQRIAWEVEQGFTTDAEADERISS
jgi:hypothetical protein